MTAIAVALITTLPTANSAPPNTSPAIATTVRRGDPPSARRSIRHTDPAHQNSSNVATAPMNADQRSSLLLSSRNLAIFACESLGFGGEPGNTTITMTSTTNAKAPNALHRSHLAASTSPPPVSNSGETLRRLWTHCKRLVRFDARYRHAMVGGGVVMVVLMILVLPVAIMLGGAIWSALMG